jgi:hypothetical protein
VRLILTSCTSQSLRNHKIYPLQCLKLTMSVALNSFLQFKYIQLCSAKYIGSEIKMRWDLRWWKTLLPIKSPFFKPKFIEMSEKLNCVWTGILGICFAYYHFVNTVHLSLRLRFKWFRLIEMHFWIWGLI